MPFVKGDSNINRQGRPQAKDLVNPKSLTGTEYREKEFKQILRRLKPLNGKALRKLDEMIDDESTTEASRLKAIVFIMKTYQDMMDDLYKPINNNTDIVEDKEESLAPIISFKVQNN
jgi:hypothetical protein